MPDIQVPGWLVSGLQVLFAFLAAFGVALWLSLIVWTFRDVKARSRDPFAILLATLMVVIFGPLGLILYFLLRPQVTLAELYERSLEEEALLQDLEEKPRCSGCSRVVEKHWLVCPDCHTQLKRACQHCGEKLNLRWNICPNCGTLVNQTTPLMPQQGPHEPLDEPQRPAGGPPATINTQPTIPHEPIPGVHPSPAPLPYQTNEPQAEPVAETAEPIEGAAETRPEHDTDSAEWPPARFDSV